MLLKCARRNKLESALPSPKISDCSDEEWIRAQRQKRSNFGNLQEFLDLYYAGCDVLRTEEDFYDLMWAYCERANRAGVIHAEVFFDPQTHTHERNQLPLGTVINGLSRAAEDAAKKLSPPMNVRLIMCFLRHRHPGCSWCSPPAKEGEAMSLLEQALQSNCCLY